LQILLDHYSQTHLRIKQAAKLADAIDFEKYIKLIGKGASKKQV
jgi:hypothetical protein